MGSFNESIFILCIIFYVDFFLQKKKKKKNVQQHTKRAADTFTSPREYSDFYRGIKIYFLRHVLSLKFCWEIYSI